MSIRRFFVFHTAAFVMFFAGASARAQDTNIQSCIDFSDSYEKVVLKHGKATENDMRSIVTLTSLLTGYAYALQDVFRARLVGWNENEDERAFLKEIYRYCSKYPQYSLQKAIRAIPQFVNTFKAIQQAEDFRCYNYIDQNKATLCADAPEPQAGAATASAPAQPQQPQPASPQIIDAPTRESE